MTQIVYFQHNGVSRAVTLKAGQNLMQGAINNGVVGIDGDCGGACDCATCHVYVDPEWVEAIGPRNATENGMLEFAEGVQDNSRLACQIVVSDALEGLVVRLPEAQH